MGVGGVATMKVPKKPYLQNLLLKIMVMSIQCECVPFPSV